MVDKILVVDDEADIVNLVKMILESEGYIVSTAFDGEEAIIKATSEMPDLILLDVVMPKKTGLEACRILKSQNKTKMIPILMFTVLGRDVDKKMSMEAGANGHVTKPFETEELISTVKSIIKKSKTERFSSALGLKHEALQGRKILLEYDPESPYERCVRDYVLEAKTNNEASVVISRVGSPVYNVITNEREVHLIPLEEKILISPILKKYGEEKLALTYDSITDTALSHGFSRTYNFIREIIQSMSGKRITALFLLNPEAHNPNETYSFRNLFSNQLRYDEEGLKKIKLI